MYIYIGRNLNSGKCYVGQSINYPWQNRIKIHINGTRGRSNLAIHEDIKNGDSFEWEIIPYLGASSASLNAIEEWQIAKNNAFTEGYNGTPRARGGGPRSETSRRKMSESKKLLYSDPTQCQKQSNRTKGEKHPFWNVKPEDHPRFRHDLRTPEVLDYIFRMLNEGCSLRYIAHQMGEGRTTIRRIIAEMKSEVSTEQLELDLEE